MISVALANAYFAPANHIKAAVWAGFSETQRTAGLAEAKRLLTRLLERDGETLDETATTDADFPRHDLAVYEQACWLLQHSGMVPDGQQAGPKWAATDPDAPDGEALRYDPYRLAPAAVRWLVEDGGVTLVRG